MAAAGHRSAALMAVAAALLLAGAALTVADGGRPGGQSQRQGTSVRAVCVKVHGVVGGETCASVARDAGLTLRVFTALNPNVTCAALFPGQWLCVDGALIG